MNRIRPTQPARLAVLVDDTHELVISAPSMRGNRIDLIVERFHHDAPEWLCVVGEVTGGKPTPPTCPDGWAVIGRVHVPAALTTVVEGNIEEEPQPPLVEFLRARLDEDERVAQAATAARWRYNSEKHHREPGTVRFSEAVFAGSAGKAATCVATTGESDDPQSMRDAEHIARHDPHRVLAEVEAGRELIACYLDVDQQIHQHHQRGEGAPDYLQHERMAYLIAIAFRARSYVDDPDYNESWRP